MAELVSELGHDCLICRAKAEAPHRLLQAAALFGAGLAITSGLLNLRPVEHHRAAPAKVAASAPAAAAAVTPVARRGAAAHLNFAKAQASQAARDSAATALE